MKYYKICSVINTCKYSGLDKVNVNLTCFSRQKNEGALLLLKIFSKVIKMCGKSLFFCLLICFISGFAFNGFSHVDKVAASNQNEFAVKQIHATSSGSTIVLEWLIDYASHDRLEQEGAKIAIRFIDEENYQKSKKKWITIDAIDLDVTTFTLNELDENVKYYYQIGISRTNEIKWSDVRSWRTATSWGWFHLLVLIGSLALFIHGLKTMGEGLQQAVGSKLRTQINSISSNRLGGIAAGFSITVIVQSIIASMLMIVSFVNAGLLTLTQSAGVMLGAGIGAAVTTWMVNVLAFEINLSAYALFILAFVAPFLFFGRKRWKPWMNTIFGFVFLILGLGFLTSNLPKDLYQYHVVSQLLEWSQVPFLGVLLFASIGLIISIVLQSTVATIALAMSLMVMSNLPFEAAISILLGSQIGTAINVEYASRLGNVHAKRSARIHTLFSIFGFLWIFLSFPFVLSAIVWFMTNMEWGNPIENPKDFGNTGLTIFHVLYALLNLLILIWFVPKFTQLAQKMVKSRGRSDEVFHLEYINMGNLSTADLSILEAKKEIAKFGNLTQRMSRMVRSLLYEKNRREFDKTLERIKKYEDITDRIEIEVVHYLNKLSDGNLTLQTASRIHGMNSMVNDLERVGDIFYQMSKTIERKSEEKLWFTPEQRNNLAKMFDLVDDALAIMYANLQEQHIKVNLDRANAAEDRINEKRNELRKAYLESLSNQDANFKAGMVYNDLFSSLEKVGDHVINVSEAIVGKI